ncbi:MAG: ABC-2 family transporter protein, partial [Verrucomicrobiota bacterium]
DTMKTDPDGHKPEAGIPHPESRVPSSAPVRRPSTLVRYLGIYAALWKNSVMRETMFKTNFLLWILVEFLWFGLQLCFISVLYLHTDRIGTWTKWEVVMLVGASHFIQQTFQAFFLVNCTNLSELVRTGKFDFLLLLPVNTRFVVSLRQVDLGAFVNAGSGVAVMVYAARQLHLTPTVLHVLGFLALCAAGILIHYSLMFLLAAISWFPMCPCGCWWTSCLRRDRSSSWF